MKPLCFMLIAGEASGDLLAAELVSALREKVLESECAPTTDVQPLRTELAPRFFGAGGPSMAAAGVELVFDMMQHSVIGVSDVLKNYFKFRRLFQKLFRLAIERQPDVIVGVDYGGFNLRFGKAIKNYVRHHHSEFRPWNPKIVQFVSPQVWASRPQRAHTLAGNNDLLLSIFPFEKDWYARRVPKLRVQFVGHPMVERFGKSEVGNLKSEETAMPSRILLLPGSRKRELQRHLPVMLDALRLIRSKLPRVEVKMVLPSETLIASAKSVGVTDAGIEIQVGDLSQALAQTVVAISKTGTVALECAFFGVPAVTLYKLSWPEYQYAKRIVTVPTVTMPNLLAGEEVFPEFIQDAATPENIAQAALELLNNESQRKTVRAKLRMIVASLGGPGASHRAAAAIMNLLR